MDAAGAGMMSGVCVCVWAWGKGDRGVCAHRHQPPCWRGACACFRWGPGRAASGSRMGKLSVCGKSGVAVPGGTMQNSLQCTLTCKALA